MRIAIVGGGIAGLTAGYELTKKGYPVVVLEKEAELGGQAGTFPIAGTRLEKFYHHLFTSDRHIVGLMEELGLARRLRWLESRVGFFYGGRIYNFVTPFDLLRFSPLPFPDRVRLGLLTLYLQRLKDWRKLETVTAEEWVTRYGGRRIYEVVWGPLLRGKFGDRAGEVSMAWLWGKLKVRRSLKGRGLQKEFLGYPEGSFQLITDELARRIRERGGEIRTASPVKSIVAEGGGVRELRLRGGEAVPADVVIVTVPSPAFLRMFPDMPDDYASFLKGVRYQQALCLVLKLRHSLSHIYWLNIADRDMPFLAAIEHTNYIHPQVYNGHHILYLSNYLPPGHPLLDYSAEELFHHYLPGIRRINPRFAPEWVEEMWLFRDEGGQPVITCGYSKRIPPHRTPIRGLYLANTTQIYPEDRGTNYSVRLGQDIARLVDEDMREGRIPQRRSLAHSLS